MLLPMDDEALFYFMGFLIGLFKGFNNQTG